MGLHRFSSVSYFRNFIFGVEDSLVSTVGLLSGVAIAGVPKATIFLTGIVLLLVEGLAMAAGSFLTESSVEEYTHKAKGSIGGNIISGTIMFFSYFLSGFIPLSPYIFWPVDVALKLSVCFSVIALFFLGVVGAKMSDTRILKDGLRMVFVGGIAIAVGMFAGSILSNPIIKNNMNGYVINIEKASIENENFRKVLYTTQNSQLVVMSLKPGEEIGSEVHQLDQFIRVETGSGKTILNGFEHELKDGSAIVVPAGVEHNIINTSDVEMKLYTVYSPPNHRDQIIHKTKADASADEEEHFDGKTTESP
ncbi:MAG: VIT1/CCC1 transporter family protein [Candidatus Yanofskybacteria bacterium]|nr:VIT1/CCC1 transporter family protein [Candidatus Yanofskybacteria bacterium]